ncbi:MAG: phytoene/squalene synthase family protein [Taibaiella sp.]|nr:phytoene/squalene synthase family protein [Taibaiella sp.]
MKEKFDQLSARCSKITTHAYSTSFSLGIRFLDKKLHKPIYGIYGFVRFADEIVDSFHSYDKATLLEQFAAETYAAIDRGISLNPILNSFQEVVNGYNIDRELIDTFLDSMRMDLGKISYDDANYHKYILGSAEVVGLMCLKVFVNGDNDAYERLTPYAMKLGSAFQKVNFLRDAREDIMQLGRNYFPDADLLNFTAEEKRRIELDIQADFDDALKGIKMLAPGARRGVYLAYYYYRKLFEKIKRTDVKRVMTERIRIPNGDKLLLAVNSYMRHQFNML